MFREGVGFSQSFGFEAEQTFGHFLGWPAYRAQYHILQPVHRFLDVPLCAFSGRTATEGIYCFVNASPNQSRSQSRRTTFRFAGCQRPGLAALGVRRRMKKRRPPDTMPEALDFLLYEVCVDLGFCVPPQDKARICATESWDACRGFSLRGNEPG